MSCATPDCEREAEPLPYRTKCCITCTNQPGLQGVHLAWCQVRNGEHHSQTRLNGGSTPNPAEATATNASSEQSGLNA